MKKVIKNRFPFIKQLNSQDCGFTCVRILSKYYGVDIPATHKTLVSSNLQKKGISLSELGVICNEIGYETLLLKSNFHDIEYSIPLPAIFYWNQNHYIVVYRITKGSVYVSDPAYGKLRYSKNDFVKGWTQSSGKGIVLLLEPTNKLYKKNTEENTQVKDSHYIYQYFKKYKSQFALIAVTLLISSLIELIFPFFTQKIIDKGVMLKNLSLVYLILGAQLTVFVSRIGLEFYRSWLFIHISSRISLSIISDFLSKLMKLPLRFFNSKTIGDLTQRIQDHKRIEDFLSKDLIQTAFSFFTIIIYLSILFYLNKNVFLIAFICSTIELLWIFSFLKKIKNLDHKTFSLHTHDQNKIYEMINAMQEIKLNNLEHHKREEWQDIQVNMYNHNINKLKVDQQYESYRFIGFIQTLLIIFACSLAIINQSMTIGTMLAIMFIIGGINNPISQLINFVLKYQLVKVSFERLNEIHSTSDEVDLNKVSMLSEIKSINVKNIHFSYNKTNNILHDISLKIPPGKTTAIVGVSGSGKTTLLKLLLKFYTSYKGSIEVGNYDLKEIKNSFWRDKCGVILQDSYLFSNTIAYNISLEKNPDINKLLQAIDLTNLADFTNNLPLKYNTIIGTEGIGISQGQRQRILIARAIYKNPDYLFFDEATNALDANNEKIIVENINNFFKHKTLIVVAHRLSTVKNADQIIVLDNGQIIERGNHQQLIKHKGKYYELVKNQLELGL